jgi:N-acetylmuramoyl-L-alanine amidase
MSNKYLFILDAGHGGLIDGIPQTPGKRSPVWKDKTILFEGEFTRAIVDALIKASPLLGIECVNLVPELTDIPLGMRVKRADIIKNKNKDKKCVYVSIHANAGGGKGIEVFTSPGLTEADAIATIFIKKLSDTFPMVRMRTDMSDGDPDKEAGFYVLKNTSMPAILTENFFMDNEYECKHYLMTEEGRHNIMLAHLAAMVTLEKENCHEGS